MNWDKIIVDIEPADTVTLLDFFKGYIGEDTPDNDTALIQALNTAGPHIETYLDRIVAKRPVDEYFPHHFGVVELHNMPVDTQAPLNVFLNGHQQSDYDVFLYRGKTAVLTRQGMKQDMPMDWRAFDQVTVTYTAGFDPLPVDLANAIVYTANLLYKSEGTGTAPGGSSGAVKSVAVYDVGSISYDTGNSSGGAGTGTFASTGVIPDTAAQILTRYKRLAA